MCVFVCLWFCVRTSKNLLKYWYFHCFFLKLLNDLKSSCCNRADALECQSATDIF